MSGTSPIEIQWGTSPYGVFNKVYTERANEAEARQVAESPGYYTFAATRKKVIVDGVKFFTEWEPAPGEQERVAAQAAAERAARS